MRCATQASSCRALDGNRHPRKQINKPTKIRQSPPPKVPAQNKLTRNTKTNNIDQPTDRPCWHRGKSCISSYDKYLQEQKQTQQQQKRPQKTRHSVASACTARTYKNKSRRNNTPITCPHHAHAHTTFGGSSHANSRQEDQDNRKKRHLSHSDNTAFSPATSHHIWHHTSADSNNQSKSDSTSPRLSRARGAPPPRASLSRKGVNRESPVAPLGVLVARTQYYADTTFSYEYDYRKTTLIVPRVRPPTRCHPT